MAEYIEREAALEKISNAVWWAQDDIVSVALSAAKRRVRKIPAAEVAPVRHGRWEMYFADKYLMCSACKASFWDENGDGGPNYCPNCGAKMDGGAESA